MQAGQLRPGDVVIYPDTRRLRGCNRTIKRKRRWIFVKWTKGWDDCRGAGYFDHLVVTDEHGRGEFGLCERDGFDWKVEGDPCRKWSCGSEAPHTYSGCLDYHMAKGAA